MLKAYLCLISSFRLMTIKWEDLETWLKRQKTGGPVDIAITVLHCSLRTCPESGKIWKNKEKYPTIKAILNKCMIGV